MRKEVVTSTKCSQLVAESQVRKDKRRVAREGNILSRSARSTFKTRDNMMITMKMKVISRIMSAK